MLDNSDQPTNFWDWQALIWDQFVRAPDDIPFFVAQAKEADSAVLEIGCGTGRTLIPIAEAGVDIVGMDLSAEMLAQAREKVGGLAAETQARITLVQGDMQDFALDQRFDLIIMTYAFVFLLTPEAQQQALHRIGEHLTESGRLIITNPDPKLDVLASRLDPLRTTLNWDKEIRSAADERRTAIWVRRRCDPTLQRIESTFVYETLEEDGRVSERRYKSLTSRYTYRFEMAHLLALCGYSVEALYGEFARSKPFTYGDIQIWVCKKEVRP